MQVCGVHAGFMCSPSVRGMDMYNIIYHASSDLLQREFKLEPGRYELRSLEDGKVKVPEKQDTTDYVQAEV